MGRHIMNNRLLKKPDSRLLFLGIHALLFGTAFMLTPVFRTEPPSPVHLLLLPLGFLIFCVSVILHLSIAGRARSGKKTEFRDGSKNGFLRRYSAVLFFFFQFGAFFIYLLSFFPGTALFDTLFIVVMDFEMAMQHPWQYILPVRVLRDLILGMGGSLELVIFSMSVLQMLLLACVYTILFCWLKRKGLRGLPLLLVSLFWILCPILNLYSVTNGKDVPFSAFTLLWLPIAYETWVSQGAYLRSKTGISAAVLCILLSTLRNNGLHVSFFIVVCILFFYRPLWKQALGLLLLILVLAGGSRLVEKELLQTDHLFVETVGIPLQQAAAVVYYNGEISEDQLAFLDQVIPLASIRKNYTPYTADPLKYNEPAVKDRFLNEHRVEFIKLWLQLLPANLKLYIRVYCQCTYGFWALDNQRIGMRTTQLEVEPTIMKGLLKEKGYTLYEKCLVPAPVKDFLLKISVFAGAGICFWLFASLMTSLVLLHGIRSAVIGAPLFGGWLTVMAATPISYQWRYTLFIPMAFPVLYGIFLLPGSKKEDISYVEKNRSNPVMYKSG